MLARYSAAERALAAAVRADEVKKVRLEAKAIGVLARMAKNLDLEINAMTLRTRAEARLGQMLKDGERKGVIASRGKPPKGSGAEPLARAKLEEIGVDKKLSARSRKLSGIGARALTVLLNRMRRESNERGRLAVGVIDEELGRRTKETRRALAQELSDAAALSPAGRKFPVVYADPAWQRKAGIGNRAYENHYVTMTWDDILAMPVAQRVLPDAWLFLWIPRAHLLAAVEVDGVKLPLAWAVMLKWGFDAYSTCFVWTKTDEQAPEDHGTGLIAWDQDELLLLFRRGRGLPKPDTDKKHGSNYRARAGEHSEKPGYYRDMINDMTGGVPVLELFAREDAQHVLPENFFTWGNQSKNSAEAPVDGAGVPIAHDGETGEVTDAPKRRKRKVAA